MWTRAELKNNAKIVLTQNYWKSVLAAFLLIIVGGGAQGNNSSNFFRNADVSVSGGYGLFYITEIFAKLGIILGLVMISFIITLAVSLFLLNPLEIGCRRYFISARLAPGDLSLIGFGFKHSYMNIVITQFLRGLFVFLWSLLLIIPGIIKYYEYRMMPFILAENPGLDTKSVFAKSKEMMTGNKWNAFVLDLSFIGWHFLGIFTCGLLNIFYSFPYQQSTNAELYEALRSK
ncbi:MAG: DUF975 family protein [Lachnospiraceae bacterium]|nr:DUF975 family protein [Lachnospiraceae bacterium]